MFQFIKNIFSRKDNKHCIVKIGRKGENIEINVNGKKEIVEKLIKFNGNEITVGNDEL